MSNPCDEDLARDYKCEGGKVTSAMSAKSPTTFFHK